MWNIPPGDPQVYDMLQRADTVGVFQVESRAQMATLPRLKPATFYDLVVEVALIRPGPITGQMVHPISIGGPGAPRCVSAPLARTDPEAHARRAAVPGAAAAHGDDGGRVYRRQAEELRRAMGFKRSEKRMKAIEGQLRDGMARNGITGEAADTVVRSITSFALYGFPESHSASFALIVYASAYLKAHYPAAFYAALLNNQPMGSTTRPRWSRTRSGMACVSRPSTCSGRPGRATSRRTAPCAWGCGSSTAEEAGGDGDRSDSRD